MDSNEFWCRAFLGTWNGEASRQMWKLDGLAEHCEQAADAALAVAQRRGMVSSERSSGVIDGLERVQDILGELDRSGVDDERKLELLSESISSEIASLRDNLPVEQPGPTLERVEFTAERHSDLSVMWRLRGPGLPVDGLDVAEGEIRLEGATGTLRIKWGETSPPRPIEVWIERGA